MIKKILAPIDGSQNSMESLKCARDLAEKYGAQIVMVNIQKPASYEAPKPVSEDPKVLEERGSKIIEKGMDAIKGTTANIKSEVITGDPSEQILHLIDKESVDMVVMGCHGLTGVRRFLIGSVSNKVLQHSSKPVMIIK